MLWVNLIMDTFAALALATEKPTPEMFNRKPCSRDESILNEIMWRNILGQSLYQITVILVMLFFGSELFNLPFDKKTTPFYADAAFVEANPTYALWDPTQKCYLYTMVFQAFVFMQVFNLLCARSLEERSLNIFKNMCNSWMFFVIIIIIVVVQLLMVNFGGRAMRCVPLDTQQNLTCITIASGALFWGLLIKLILPARWFKCLIKPEREMTDAEEKKSIVAVARLSQRQQSLKRQSTNKKSNPDAPPQ